MTPVDDPTTIVNNAEKQRAQHQLAGHLRRGELTLLLGAGVSKGLNLPNFKELVESCERDLGIDPLESELFQRMDEVRRTYEGGATDPSVPGFLAFIRKHLYPGAIAGGGNYPPSLLQQEMLIALGAIVMSSVRGSVADVLTLNFDDVLDWYLQLHGFRTQVVTELPTWLRGDVDVHIHHIHGFLPLTGEWEPSDWLLLTYDQLVERLTHDNGDPWPTLIGSLIQSKILLAVGTSMNDIDIDIVLRRAQRYSVDGVNRGFVLGCQLTDAAKAKCLRFGLTPVSLETYEEIPRFILGVCQEAARSD